MSEEGRVEELTGLYGPVFFAEKQVQRIWATRAFCLGGLVTRSGKRLEVLDPGRWNFQEGPDFCGAILEVDGQRRHGDVEIHLHERDWLRHGHGADPNFDGVVLHVVLFPDRRGRGQAEASAPGFETLEWLKYLDRDLETYFEDQGVDQLLDEELPMPLAALLELPLEARENLLLEAAEQRWKRKVAVARKRMELMGAAETFHQVFLEVLGLRRNRATMSRVAMAYPQARWREDPLRTVGEAFERFRGAWHLAGCRPANHPRRRLEAYGKWMAMERVASLRRFVPGELQLPSGLSLTGSRISRRRREGGVSKLEEEWRRTFAPGVSGTRFHTWIGDGLLPLVEGEDSARDLFSLWSVWPLGDIPDRMKGALKALELIGPGRPLCNAWIQGMIRMLEPDYEPSSPSGGGKG